MSTPAGERRERMVALWGLTLEAFKARLEADKDGELSASFMSEITGFLRDSNISVETLEEAKEAVEDLAHIRLAAEIAEVTKDMDQTPEPPTPKPAEAVAPLDRAFAPPPPPRA